MAVEETLQYANMSWSALQFYKKGGKYRAEAVSSFTQIDLKGWAELALEPKQRARAAERGQISGDSR